MSNTILQDVHHPGTENVFSNLKLSINYPQRTITGTSTVTYPNDLCVWLEKLCRKYTSSATIGTWFLSAKLRISFICSYENIVPIGLVGLITNINWVFYVIRFWASYKSI